MCVLSKDIRYMYPSCSQIACCIFFYLSFAAHAGPTVLGGVGEKQVVTGPAIHLGVGGGGVSSVFPQCWAVWVRSR